MSTAISSPSSPSPRSAFHHPSPRNALAARHSPRIPTSASPRPPTNALSSTSGPQQPKHNLAEHSPVIRRSAGYVDAATQYSPDGLPPTAGRRLAAHAGRPPGASGAGASSTKKRKEGVSQEPVAEHMSGSSATSGATRRSQHTHDEPRTREYPDSGSSSSAATADTDFQEARSTHGHSAAPKRSRPEGTRKIMPHQYEKCNPKDLGSLIANMLMELIRINDRIPLRDGRLTRFHSRAPPGISVSDYLQRLIQHATLSPPIMLSMVYYIDRLCTLYPPFTVNSLTVHRFLITAATVAAKGLSDSFWTNPTYARIGGIPVSELATLELELLKRVEWKIVPRPEVLEEYYNSLVERTDGFEIEGISSDSPTSVGSSSLDDGDSDKNPGAKETDVGD